MNKPILRSLSSAAAGAIAGASLVFWLVFQHPAWLAAESSSASRSLEAAGIPRRLLEAAIEGGTQRGLKAMAVGYVSYCDSSPRGTIRSVDSLEIHAIEHRLLSDGTGSREARVPQHDKATATRTAPYELHFRNDATGDNGGRWIWSDDDENACRCDDDTENHLKKRPLKATLDANKPRERSALGTTT